jgi:single-stranded DNA-binding protein
MNIAIVRGTLSRAPDVRALPSGDEVASLEVTIPADGETAKAESVPVSVADPPLWVRNLEPGDEVAVLGRIRRRFFKAGLTTQSRTELVAERVVPAGRRRRVEALLSAAETRLRRS